ncbi:MAG: tetratricopeptide repeat protein [Aestuariibacter sp.]
MAKLKMYLLLLLTTTLLGCSSTQTPVIAANPHFLDLSFEGFEKYHIESEKEVFGLSEEARRFVIRKLQSKHDPTVRMETLVREVFNRTDFNLIYDGTANTIASETFANKTANCLSLSIMTYALAKEAGLGVVFQEIDIPEYWTRREGYSMLNGHVNLKLSQAKDPSRYYFDTRSMIVDFDPFSPKKHFPSVRAGRERILAMFYNNKGADALISGEFRHAYAYFREALIVDKQFQSAWINLGILYRMTGHWDWAEKTYSSALALNDNNLTVLENMAVLYDVQGLEKKAQKIMEKVHTKRRSNPYYHYIQGEQELENGEYELALAHYRKAISLDKSKHEFYFGMAKTYAELGDVDKSQFYLKRAKRSANFDDQKSRYQSKLDLLTSL